MGDNEYHIIEIINTILVVIFVIEVIIQIIAEGPRHFFFKFSNLWDFGVVLVSIIELLIKDSSSETSVFSSS